MVSSTHPGVAPRPRRVRPAVGERGCTRSSVCRTSYYISSPSPSRWFRRSSPGSLCSTCIHRLRFGRPEASEVRASSVHWCAVHAVPVPFMLPGLTCHLCIHTAGRTLLATRGAERRGDGETGRRRRSDPGQREGKARLGTQREGKERPETSPACDSRSTVLLRPALVRQPCYATCAVYVYSTVLDTGE